MLTGLDRWVRAWEVLGRGAFALTGLAALKTVYEITQGNFSEAAGSGAATIALGVVAGKSFSISAETAILAADIRTDIAAEG